LRAALDVFEKTEGKLIEENFEFLSRKNEVLGEGKFPQVTARSLNRRVAEARSRESDTVNRMAQRKRREAGSTTRHAGWRAMQDRGTFHRDRQDRMGGSSARGYKGHDKQNYAANGGMVVRYTCTVSESGGGVKGFFGQGRIFTAEFAGGAEVMPERPESRGNVSVIR
jgi:hypothetical protein